MLSFYLDTLTELYLIENEIIVVNPVYLQSLVHLQKLHLDLNQILVLPDFTAMTSLLEIHLDHNNITHLDADSFVTLTAVTLISIQSNPIGSSTTDIR